MSVSEEIENQKQPGRVECLYGGLLTPKDIQEQFRCSSATATRIKRRPAFPKPIYLGVRKPRWRPSEIEAYIESLGMEWRRSFPYLCEGGPVSHSASKSKLNTGPVRMDWKASVSPAHFQSTHSLCVANARANGYWR